MNRDTPFFKFIRPYIDAIFKNYVNLNFDKPSLKDYIKAIQSSVNCMIDFNIIESKIEEQMNEDFELKEEN